MGSTYSFQASGITLAANKLLMDIFNAVGSGKIIKLTLAEAYVINTAAVTGISIAIEGYRTSTIGTGGTPLTADKFDTDSLNLPTEITCRLTPAAGATINGNALFAGNTYTEEGANYQPQLPMYRNHGATRRKQVTIREGEGLLLKQGPFGTVGKIGLRFDFEVI